MGSGKIHESSQPDESAKTNEVSGENVDSNIPVLQERNDTDKLGEYQGQCKWFNDRLGFGFCTITGGDKKGEDIFVHHSGVNTKNSHYKTLKKGEYIQFDIIESEIKGPNAQQAVNVTGISGGPLMCDCISTGSRRPIHSYEQGEQYYSRGPPNNYNGRRPDELIRPRFNGPRPYSRQEKGEWQNIPPKKINGPPPKTNYRNAVTSGVSEKRESKN